MPTSTLPFEILFEFINDTVDEVTFQLTQEGNGYSSGGAVILLQINENVSLVLNAGSTYRYTVKHR